MAPGNPEFQMKREREDEEQFSSQATKRTRREASSKAGIEIEKYIGPGGYFDSQTTDTQYFDFTESQTSGSSKQYLESQDLEIIMVADPRDDDLYQPETQSQDDSPVRLERTNPMRVVPELNDSNPIPPPCLSFSRTLDDTNTAWGPNSDKQDSFNNILKARYLNAPDPVTKFLEKQDLESRECRWSDWRDEAGIDLPARLATKLLFDNAQTVSFHQANTLQKAHTTVASQLVRVAYRLIHAGGCSKNPEDLRNSIMDGKMLLDLADELVDEEISIHKLVDEMYAYSSR
ncbi:hypothetical protein K435DRAFT_872775 [Dendrothele bispora CBS 962.96]|uniref:Uncharacterized protein n=1 Tax=Dendrothele bispora (strain CBS 962.96) TaxID=1314807 RepID=A0A4S8L0T3_DENBC|nr:hypothetical protein K435DRAFT_872775 [Dendrothele bispora CBS 962.96]